MLTKPYFGRLFFEADKGGSGGSNGDDPAAASKTSGTESEDAKPSGKGGDDGFTPITSEAQLAEWKASTRKHIAAEVRKQIEAEIKAEEDRKAAEAERKAAEERGEFDKVKASLEQQISDITTERDGLVAKVERYEALAQQQVEAIKGELPAEALDGFPEEAEPVDQLAWLEDRKALLKKLGFQQNRDGAPRFPKTPSDQGEGKPDIRKTLAQSVRYT